VFPRDFFVDYWNPSIRDQVFVAMPFAPQFSSVWERAFRPGIEDCGLTAYRVDTRSVSDSILVDILDGIAHSRLVLCDVSPVSCAPVSSALRALGGRGRRPLYPNGNVMYELGLAHATRQAEEVVLVRNEAEQPLLFDMSGVRVHGYPSNDLDAARETIRELVRDAMDTVEKTKGFQVLKAKQALTLTDLKLIRKWWPYGFRMWAKDPDGDLSGIPGELNVAVADLQRLGIVRVGSLPADQACAVEMVWTDFGNAVVAALGPTLMMGRTDPAEKARAEAAAAAVEAEAASVEATQTRPPGDSE